MSELSRRVESWTARLDASLDRALPSAGLLPEELHRAMRYACDGGKRVRALLCYATAEALDIDPGQVDSSACAVELIHAYSLVHDDLPCMDDDALRRGKPTVHVEFGESTAVLVGDALQALAVQVLAEDTGLPPAARVAMIAALCRAAGSRGMVGGQAMDLAAEGRELGLAELEALHVHKTGALIHASVSLAYTAAGLSEQRSIDALDHFGNCIGLAFQIQDDLLDVEGDAEVVGKATGKDEHRLKSTYPGVMGLRAARERAEDLFQQARLAARSLGPGSAALEAIANDIQVRNH